MDDRPSLGWQPVPGRAAARRGFSWPTAVATGFVALVLLGSTATAAWGAQDGDGDGVSDRSEFANGLSRHVADTDGDGLLDAQELAAGSDGAHPDTDGDGLTDREEVDFGSSPLLRDTDGDTVDDRAEWWYGSLPTSADGDQDGIPDAQEIAQGSDPSRVDTDGDGIPDAQESGADCDGDGARDWWDGDDDDDGLADGSEPLAWRCRSDVDGDGVLDGHEGARRCVERRDCDGDGLEDGFEVANSFDPLDPDTFGLNFRDGTVWAFQAAGQTPSPDGDADGIPDAWEGSDGLVQWDGLAPAAGQTDILIEYVRVTTPSTTEVDDIRFLDVYEDIEAYLQDVGGFAVSWVETRVARPDVPEAPTNVSAGPEYYRDVLSRSRHGTNPFVVSIVLNAIQVPHLNEETGSLSIGRAHLNGMMGIASYQGSMEYYLTNPDNGAWFRSPAFLETAITSGLATNYGPWDDAGVLANGDVWVASQGATYTWTPYYFQSPIAVDAPSGDYELTVAGITFQSRQFVSVVFHELGHTLGLCHSQDLCDYMSQQDKQNEAASTMSYNNPDPGVNLLPSEVEEIRRVIQCPPQSAIQAVADRASSVEVVLAKYGVSETDPDRRKCLPLTPVAADLTPLTTGLQRPPPAPIDAAPVYESVTVPTDPVPLVGGASVMSVSLAAGYLAGRLRLRRR